MENKIKEEEFIIFLMEELSKSHKENMVLKVRNKFNIQQAENTMKRLTEKIGSYVIKEIIRKEKKYITTNDNIDNGK